MTLVTRQKELAVCFQAGQEVGQYDILAHFVTTRSSTLQQYVTGPFHDH